VTARSGLDGAAGMHVGAGMELHPEAGRTAVGKRTALGLNSVVSLDLAGHCRFGSVP